VPGLRHNLPATISIRSTAYHEAGHAVIARVLTLASGPATIEPDKDKGTAGFSITLDPYECHAEWESRGKNRDYAAAFHARIMTYMAGAETEAILLGRPPIGDGDDRLQIALMAQEMRCTVPWEGLEPRLRAMTRMLVRRHRAGIERVAKALLAKKTLSAKQLDRLVGRSVDDLNTNLPAHVVSAMLFRRGYRLTE
jgi:ATP-dependent Zn protease